MNSETKSPAKNTPFTAACKSMIDPRNPLLSAYSWFTERIDNNTSKQFKKLSKDVLYLNKIGNLIFVKGLKSLSRKVAVSVDGMTIDGFINGVARSFLKPSQQISYSQTGLVRSYVVYFGLFMLVLIFVFLLSPGVLSWQVWFIALYCFQ